MPDDPFQGGQLYPAETLGQGLHFGDEHDLRHFNRDRVAYTHAMALEYFILECGGVFRRYGCIGQDTEAGIYTIHGFLFGYDLFHRIMTGIDPPGGGLAQDGPCFSGRNGQGDPGG